MASAKASGAWVMRLVSEDFSARCREDCYCFPCAAAFCDHCCGGHHHGHGHEVVVFRAATEGAQPGAALGRATDRETFCLDCGAGFSAALCRHHDGHETVRVVVCDGRHRVRCTGSEPWFHVFDGVETYKDELGHILVPLHPRSGPGPGRFSR